MKSWSMYICVYTENGPIEAMLELYMYTDYYYRLTLKSSKCILWAKMDFDIFNLVRKQLVIECIVSTC